jgi:hypothetical protein
MRPKSNIRAGLLGLALCVGAVGRPQLAREGLKGTLLFEAHAVRATVRMGEPIYLRLRLKNVSNENVLVKRRFRLNDAVSLQVTGQQGQKAAWCGIIPDFADLRGDFVFLAPGAHVQGVMRVNCDPKQRVTWGYSFPGPGEYTVTASYELPYPLSVLKKAAGSAAVVKGPVVAKPVRITILPKN